MEYYIFKTMNDAIFDNLNDQVITEEVEFDQELTSFCCNNRKCSIENKDKAKSIIKNNGGHKIKHSKNIKSKDNSIRSINDIKNEATMELNLLSYLIKLEYQKLRKFRNKYVNK
ncbi:hypothetical protein A3Q56_07692 [Intoshia linei]|uniref:Uncharacterized protein n=1 Tax=Intoshia linei TaxID=1819745 RepID=A0A177AST1_9BILA|nr:hypothetical protein A3Q56_07692 [Intoshia linei]